MTTAKLPLTDPSLVGHNIYLRPVSSDDVPSLFTWKVQHNVQRHDPFPPTIASAIDFGESLKAGRAADNGSFAIVRTKDNRLVGLTGFRQYNPLNRSAEILVFIDPDETRKRLGSEGVKVLAKYLFRQRGMNKLYLTVDSTDEAANQFLPRIGFKQSGILRDHYFADGVFYNGHFFELCAFELDF